MLNFWNHFSYIQSEVKKQQDHFITWQFNLSEFLSLSSSILTLRILGGWQNSVYSATKCSMTNDMPVNNATQ